VEFKLELIHKDEINITPKYLKRKTISTRVLAKYNTETEF
jgi:hypothetical protein